VFKLIGQLVIQPLKIKPTHFCWAVQIREFEEEKQRLNSKLQVPFFTKLVLYQVIQAIVYVHFYLILL
jgi:hypothetical protein